MNDTASYSQRPFETFLIFLTIFISSITFFDAPFEGYFHYIIFMLFLPFFVSRFGFPKVPFQLLVFPLLVGLFQLAIGNNTSQLFMKIFIGVFLSTSFYYYVFEYYEHDVDRLFRLYLKGCRICCYIGLGQWICFKLHISAGYNYSWLFNKWGLVASENGGLRVNSIFAEPAQFAIVMAPAVFVAFYSLISRTNAFFRPLDSCIILLLEFLSTASTGYIGFFVIVLLLLANYGYFMNLLIGIAVVIALGVGMYSYVPEFRSRVDSSIGLWVDEDLSIKNVNSSSFVLYNNFHIARENFMNSYMLGTGLGSHKVAFEKYTLTRNTKILNFAFNQSDANSMFLRLLSETGIIGVSFILILIFKCYVRRNADEEDRYWITSNSLLVIIILSLLRQGNYFLNGFPFILWLYYFNYRAYFDKYRSTEKSNEEIRENEVIVQPD
ncbi:MAG: O-antigen ligase family protein [Bacteroidia bacterium]